MDQYFFLSTPPYFTSLTWLTLVWVQKSHLAVILENAYIIVSGFPQSFFHTSSLTEHRKPLLPFLCLFGSQFILISFFKHFNIN